MSKIKMRFAGNIAYTADDAEGTTLADLLEQVQDAITEWGEDAEVVLYQTNNGRGANYGELAGWPLFATMDERDEE